MTFFLPRKSWRDIFLRSLPSKYCRVKSGAKLPTFNTGRADLAGAACIAGAVISGSAESRRVAAAVLIRICHLFDCEVEGSAGLNASWLPYACRVERSIPCWVRHVQKLNS